MTGLKIKLADINNNGNNTMPRGRYWESLERGARGVRAGGFACEFVHWFILQCYSIDEVLNCT